MRSFRRRKEEYRSRKRKTELRSFEEKIGGVQ